jgi:hypothetical protein
MIAWRIWFAQNEVTHDKLLSSGIICSYIQSLENINCAPIEDIIKGKRPLGAVMPLAGPKPLLIFLIEASSRYCKAQY